MANLRFLETLLLQVVHEGERRDSSTVRMGGDEIGCHALFGGKVEIPLIFAMKVMIVRYISKEIIQSSMIGQVFVQGCASVFLLVRVGLIFA